MDTEIGSLCDDSEQDKKRIQELEAENQQIKNLLQRLYDNNEYDPGLWAEVADFLHLTPVSHEPR